MKYVVENGKLMKCIPDIPDRYVREERPRVVVSTQELDITIPDGVTSIDKEAFSIIYNYIKSLKIPDGFGFLPPFLKYLASLEELVIGEGPTRIPSGFLKNNRSLKKVVIPESVEVIDIAAFSGCASLEEVCFCGNGLRHIDGNAFLGCTGLTEIRFPQSLKRIGEGALYNDKALKKVIIPSAAAEPKLGWKSLFGFSKPIEIEIVKPDGNTETILLSETHLTEEGKRYYSYNVKKRMDELEKK